MHKPIVNCLVECKVFNPISAFLLNYSLIAGRVGATYLSPFGLSVFLSMEFVLFWFFCCRYETVPNDVHVRNMIDWYKTSK